MESKDEGEGIVVSHVEEGRLAHVQGMLMSHRRKCKNDTYYCGWVFAVFCFCIYLVFAREVKKKIICFSNHFKLPEVGCVPTYFTHE